MSGSPHYPEDWDDRRQAVLMQDGFTCQECGATDTTLHVHHKVPISEGGSHELENLQALCADCHADEHGTNPCPFCELVGRHQVDVLDESGGSALFVCENCFGQLESGSGCCVCRKETSGKYHIHEPGRSGFSADICSECRKLLLFDNTAHISHRLATSAIDRIWDFGEGQP